MHGEYTKGKVKAGERYRGEKGKGIGKARERNKEMEGRVSLPATSASGSVQREAGGGGGYVAAADSDPT